MSQKELNRQLFSAAEKGDLDQIKHLFAQGADVNAQNTEKQTPLHKVIEPDLYPLARFIVKNGAQPNIKDVDGNTPLHLAAGQGNHKLVRLLLAHGAAIDALNTAGETPLFKAAIQNRGEVVFDLLEQGASQILPMTYEHTNSQFDGLYVVTSPGESEQLLLCRNRPEVFVKSALDSSTTKPEEKETLVALMRAAEADEDEKKAMISVLMRNELLAWTFDMSKNDFWRAQLLTNAVAYMKEQRLPLCWKSLSAPMQRESAADCINVHDMVSEFVDYVLLPALIEPMLDKRGDLLRRNKVALKNLDLEFIQKKLISIASEALFQNLPPHQILGLSHAWRHSRSAFPQVLRPEAGGDWHPLTNGVISVPKGKGAEGWNLHCLSSSDALNAEHERMSHCVDTYSGKCLNGKHHIYSVRDPQGNPISTLVLKRNLELDQNQGPQNTVPDIKALIAGRWLVKAIQEHAVEVNSKRGETPESKQANTAPLVIKTIGYWPTKEIMNQAFMYYTGTVTQSMEWDDKKKKYVSNGPSLIYAAAIQSKESHLAYDGGFARRIADNRNAEQQGGAPLDLWLEATGARESLDKLRAEIAPSSLSRSGGGDLHRA